VIQTKPGWPAGRLDGVREVGLARDLPDLASAPRGARRLEGEPVGEHRLEDLAQIGLVSAMSW
jgi:hypothetical protein